MDDSFSVSIINAQRPITATNMIRVRLLLDILRLEVPEFSLSNDRIKGWSCILMNCDELKMDKLGESEAALVGRMP